MDCTPNSNKEPGENWSKPLQQEDKNTAVASLVFGILALIFSIFLAWLGLTLCIIGILLAFNVDRHGENAGFARAGLVLSLVSIALVATVTACVTCIACAA